jgi:hypothetical protein
VRRADREAEAGVLAKCPTLRGAAVALQLLLPCATGAARRPRRRPMEESPHPRGALLFMLICLLVLTALWLNAYLRLWRG